MADIRLGVTGRIGLGAALAALGVAVYVTLAGQGNGGGGDTACAAAAPRAAALDPLVGGELAAFRVARAPDDVSDLAFTAPDGSPTSLAAFAGRVALVNLWATWCAPCRYEMPSLSRLETALAGDDFAVVPVSVDIAEPERSAEFLVSVGADNLPLYTDRTTEIYETVKARGLAIGLPVTLLVDRDGCRLGHINGPAEWDGADARRLIEAALAGGAGREG
jgi:thiol-disulfide isomerase/thioredoxin